LRRRSTKYPLPAWDTRGWSARFVRAADLHPGRRGQTRTRDHRAGV